MKILQISTYDIRGGAARAAYRLHQGLRESGQDCRMLVRYKDTKDDYVIRVEPKELEEEAGQKFLLEVVLQGHYINSNRTDISNTIFSLPYPGIDLSALATTKGADIINLHWVARYQSLPTLHRLFSLNKPVVWTLHDQWAFTGGCHYAAGCLKYRSDCMSCPQLADDPFHLPAAILRDKGIFFQGADLTIVTPSRWMAECARQSCLFKDLRVEVIPNSLENDLYNPVAKDVAKEKMGFDKEIVTLLFGGEDGNERRKGFKELIAAIQYCRKDRWFQSLYENGRIKLICFGHPNDEIDALGIPVTPLGYLDSDEKIRDAYASADIFILPSLEDNLPNTVLEAMSCGTPVVAFETGGIPEMVANGVTGQLVPLGETGEMGEALLSLIFNPDKREAMGKACREKIEEEYGLEVQARGYLSLYEDVSDRNRHSKTHYSAPTQEQVWEADAEVGREKVLSAPVESGMGLHFSAIYDKVAFKALKEFAPEIHEKWQVSEADRKARFDQIEELSDLLRESEADRKARLAQINELTDLFGESEADRKARLDQAIELADLLRESEADRKATLEQIGELARLLDKEEADWRVAIDRLNQRADIIKEKELRQLSRSKLIESLQAGIQKLRDELERAYMRAGAAEKGWRNLEETFVVRHARNLRFIRVRQCPLSDRVKSRRRRPDGMRIIAVDMTPVLPGGENGGAKIFTIELLKSFQNCAPDSHFLLLTSSWNHEDLAILDGPNMSRICVLTGKRPTPKPLTTQYPGMLRRGLDRMGRYFRGRLQTGVAPRRLLGSRGAELLFCPFTAPTYAEPGIPTVSIIYDLQHRDLPQFFSPHEIGIRNSFMNEVSQRADHIICISEYVRQTVLKHLKIDPKRTHTAHICIHSRLSTPDKKDMDSCLSELGISHRPYMFYPANYWPHKNHRMLLTAYGMFLARNPDAVLDVVFTGALENLERELKGVAERMGLTERVHFLGFLPQRQIEAVWHGCEFLIFPSLYEGFGIPVLEAMSIGKPVLCSNATSLPEVGGQAALYFDPRKPGDIVRCLERMVKDASLKKDLAVRGYIRSADFRPEKMTDNYLGIFSSALGDHLPVSNGVTGIFQDGWIGEEMTISFGRGSKDRVLEVRISAPSWLPAAQVKLRVRDEYATVQSLSLRRGREVTLVQPLPEGQGRYFLTVSPTFRPSELMIGEDNRALGVKCQGCWLIDSERKKTSLLKGGGEWSPASA